MTENTIIEKEKFEITEQLIKDYLFGIGSSLSDSQFKMFINVAKSFNLNPFKREIYCIPYEKNVKNGDKWDKVKDMNIVTGYQVYIDRASASGMLDGWNTEIVYINEVCDENGKEIIKQKIKGAKIKIYRKDWKMPFEWEVGIREFVKLNKDGTPMGIWKTMPEFMIKKVAIGQGFRLAFPNELGGMPYLSEEITAEKENIPVIEKKEPILISSSVAERYEGKGIEIEDNIQDNINIANNGEVTYYCIDCGKEISKKVYDFKDKHLCFQCQAKDAIKVEEVKEEEKTDTFIDDLLKEVPSNGDEIKNGPLPF